VSPTEGPAESENWIATVLGVFSKVPVEDILTIEFGGVPVLELVDRNDTALTVVVPPIELEEGEEYR